MNLIDRVKNILFSPKTEWEKISMEEQSLGSVVISYILPLSIFAAVCAYIGFGLIGIDTGFLGLRIKGNEWGLYEAISRLASSLISVVIAAYVIDALAPSFKSEKNINRSAQLVAYSATASLVGSVFLILPVLAIVTLLCSLYGIYLMYLGIGPLKKTPDDQKIIYMIVSILVYAVIAGLVLFIFHKIMAAVLGIDFSMFSPQV
jgi:hypothetical protein